MNALVYMCGCGHECSSVCVYVFLSDFLFAFPQTAHGMHTRKEKKKWLVGWLAGWFGLVLVGYDLSKRRLIE